VRRFILKILKVVELKRWRILFNYNILKLAVKAWLNSASHKGNIEGNFTLLGIMIRGKCATTGKNTTLTYLLEFKL
jgi:hypothetical protein